MTRRLITAILLCLSWAGYFSAAESAEPRQPNVVFILIDDLGYGDLSCYGNEDIETPRIDALAQQGIRFTQFYVGAPICSAARVAFTTGQFPSRHGIQSFLSSREENRNRHMPDFLDPKAPSVARALREAGYATGHFGKWHMGGGRDVDDAPLPEAYGFDESYSSFEGLGDRVLIEGDRLSEQSAKLGHGKIDWAAKRELTAAYVDRAVDFLQRHRDQPAYVQLWLCDVHDPFAPSPEQMKKFEKFSSNPPLQRYYAVLDEVDRQVGRLLDALDEMGAADDTLIVLASDNGPTAWPSYAKEGHDAPGSTGGLRGRKWSLYEGGIRSPLIVRWPGATPTGAVDETSVIGAVDFLPTLCQLAGAKAPNAELDGIDRSDAIKGKASDRRSPLFWEYGREETDLRPARPIDRSPTLAVREGPWKLLANADETQLQLYNIEESPGEFHNVAGLHPEIRDDLAAKLMAWKASLPAVPAKERELKYGEPAVVALAIGKSISKDDALLVENSALRIEAEIERVGDGVIVAHGGDGAGYALYVQDGRAAFTTRSRRKPTTIQTDEPLSPDSAHTVTAEIAGDGMMSLKIDGRAASKPQQGALVIVQPQESLDAGFDSGTAVGEYEGESRFTGALGKVMIQSRQLIPEPTQGRLVTRWAGDLDPHAPLPEYPRPQMVRPDWHNLNGYWQYAIRAKGESQPEKWDGRIVVPFAVESLLSDVQRRVGPENKLWYRRSFDKPAELGDKRLLLHFGAVDWHATVWLNGTKLGEHRGGYDPFSFDATDALKADGPQELIVSAWDPSDAGPQPRGKQTGDPHGIWYTPVTGIWQTVWLEPVAASHIESLDIVPNVDEQSVRVTVHAAGGDQSANLAATVRVEGKHDGKEVRSDAKGKPGEAIVVKIPDARLWSPDQPFLYDLVVELHESTNGNRKIDSVESYFGMRKIELAKDEKGVDRMFLNGEPLFQWGPLDQGWWPDGLYTAPTDEALRFDIEATKDVGFNMARKHVKVEPARWYYWADKLGLLVWQDMPSGMQTGPGQRNHIRGDMPDLDLPAETQEMFRLELKAMIDAFDNHPSIVVWVPFNEGWGQHNTNAVLKWTKEYDPTRLVGGPSGWTDRGYGDLYDMHSYPGPDMFPVEDGRASVLGEYGGLGLPVSGHTWISKNNWGYRSFSSKEELSHAYEDLCQRMLPLVEQGLAAAVYTQTTDVEVEVNGLFTYDRAVLKLDAEKIRPLHEAAIDRGSAEKPAARSKKE